MCLAWELLEQGDRESHHRGVLILIRSARFLCLMEQITGLIELEDLLIG